jgi:AcrR family transcriptional regulator
MEKTADSEELARPHGRPRDEAVRRRILAAALELLEAMGFAHVTCDAIAERSGASKATVYRWWPNKAAVLIDAFAQSIAPELEPPEVPTIEEYVRVQLRRFSKVLVGRNGRLRAALIAAAQDDPEVAAAFVSHWVEPRRALSRKALRRYQEEGQVPADFDVDLVLDAMYGPLQFLLMVRHGKPNQAYADGLASMLLHGFLPRAAGGRATHAGEQK